MSPSWLNSPGPRRWITNVLYAFPSLAAAAGFLVYVISRDAPPAELTKEVGLDLSIIWSSTLIIACVLCTIFTLFQHVRLALLMETPARCVVVFASIGYAIALSAPITVGLLVGFAVVSVARIWAIHSALLPALEVGEMLRKKREPRP